MLKIYTKITYLLSFLACFTMQAGQPAQALDLSKLPHDLVSYTMQYLLSNYLPKGSAKIWQGEYGGKNLETSDVGGVIDIHVKNKDEEVINHVQIMDATLRGTTLSTCSNYICAIIYKNNLREHQIYITKSTGSKTLNTINDPRLDEEFLYLKGDVKLKIAINKMSDLMACIVDKQLIIYDLGPVDFDLAHPQDIVKIPLETSNTIDGIIFNKLGNRLAIKYKDGAVTGWVVKKVKGAITTRKVDTLHYDDFKRWLF